MKLCLVLLFLFTIVSFGVALPLDLHAVLQDLCSSEDLSFLS